MLNLKYAGGCEQFKIDWNFYDNEYNQEDDELINIVSMNLDDSEIEKLVARGLDYNEELGYFNDFVMLSRYGGLPNDTCWLKSNGIFAWHVHCDPKQEKRAEEIAQLRIDEILKLFDKGINVFDTIRKEGVEGAD